MIANERQYRTSKSQLQMLLDAITEMGIPDEEISVLEKAERDALMSEVAVLRDQIKEYEDLRSGKVKVLRARGLEGLPGMLVRARIGQRLTQRELAALVGIREQQIQKYEASDYAGASLTRLREIANALKLEIEEVAELKETLEDGSKGGTLDG